MKRIVSIFARFIAIPTLDIETRRVLHALQKRFQKLHKRCVEARGQRASRWQGECTWSVGQRSGRCVLWGHTRRKRSLSRCRYRTGSSTCIRTFTLSTNQIHRPLNRTIERGKGTRGLFNYRAVLIIGDNEGVPICF